MTLEAPTFNYDSSIPKLELAGIIQADLEKLGFRIVEVDFERPWGGFLKIDKTQAKEFIERFYPDVELPESAADTTLDPKLLIVDPAKRLSWQVHERRSEFWRVIDGPIGAYLSETDEQPEESMAYESGQTVDIPVGTRHRLAGISEKRGIVAEIWIHTDSNNSSNEDDIRRISDDFGRGSPQTSKI